MNMNFHIYLQFTANCWKSFVQIKVYFSTSEAMNGQPRRDVNIFSNLLGEIDNISHRLYKSSNPMNL